MSHEWRQHPQLKKRFHPDYPDDLQVIVYDGGPRLTDKKPELVWARVISMEANAFKAQVLNQPHHLSRVKEGDEILLIMPMGSKYPIYTTPKYLKERDDWIVHPCDGCGLVELFDPPSDLIGVVFKGIPDEATLQSFTSFCPMCGGVQVIQHKNADLENN